MRGKKSSEGGVLIWLLVFTLIAVLVVTYLLIKSGSTASDPKTAVSNKENSQVDTPPPYESPNLQPTVDAWLAEQTVDYNIIVKDLQSDEIIAKHNETKTDLGASLYKPFVAYLVIRDFQSGDINPDAVLTKGTSWFKCLELMLKVSDNECGEAAILHFGINETHSRLEAYNIHDTYFYYTHTTASDIMKIMELIYEGKGLSETYHEFLLDALLNQDAFYKQGLKAGAPEGTWYSKAGWNVGAIYNDAGVLKMPDGREFVVVIMGPNGYAPTKIVDFSKSIYNALIQ